MSSFTCQCPFVNMSDPEICWSRRRVLVAGLVAARGFWTKWLEFLPFLRRGQFGIFGFAGAAGGVFQAVDQSGDLILVARLRDIQV